MRLPSRQQLGVLLVLIALVSVVGSLAVSAATAPDISVSSTNDTERGRTLVGLQAERQVTMFDSSGDVRWRFGNGSTDYFGVSLLDNGTVLTAFVTEDNRQSCGPFEPPCARTGFRLIDPQPNPHIVGEWSFPVRSKLNSEVHDVNRLPSGEFIMTDMEYERIMTVASNGTITWQWNASQHYDAPPDPTTTDWLHINDVDRIGPGRYMVSVRNANQILILERGQGVVEVINEDENGSSDENCRHRGNQLADYDNDGDITCGNPEVIDHQHNPQYLGPGAVLVADSENDRVVELHKQNGEWEVAWGVNSAEGVRFDWPRDADRLPNGNTLITDSRNNRIVEIAPNRTTVWSTDTGIWPYETDRLPYGELIGGERIDRMNRTGDLPGVAGESTFGLLQQAHAGLTYVVSLPHWFHPYHIGILALAVPLALLGGLLVWSGRRNQ